MRRRRGHVLHRDGPGRIRIRLAKVIAETLGCECDPYDIWQNNYPAAKWLDLARWGVDCQFPGTRLNVHSWDTMSECARHGIAEVYRDSTGLEVSEKGAA